jgi:hypothetical protein
LEGFTYQDENTIHVTGANRMRISLLVIPPEMPGTAGHDAMMTAGHRGNADRPEEILAAATIPAPRPTDHSPERRETGDGPVSQRE